MAQNCAKCGSVKIIPQAKVIDQGNVVVAIDGNPDALFLKKRVHSEISAKVCGNCGLIEFYADDPQLLYSAYQGQSHNLKLVK